MSGGLSAMLGKFPYKEVFVMLTTVQERSRLYQKVSRDGSLGGLIHLPLLALSNKAKSVYNCERPISWQTKMLCPAELTGFGDMGLVTWGDAVLLENISIVTFQ